jgi:hypothetical protein
MNQLPDAATDADDERPPVLSSWNQIYFFVLLFHVILVGLLYWFTRAFS